MLNCIQMKQAFLWVKDTASHFCNFSVFGALRPACSSNGTARHSLNWLLSCSMKWAKWQTNPGSVRRLGQILQVGNEEKLELPLITFEKTEDRVHLEEQPGRCFECVRSGIPTRNPRGYGNSWACERIQRIGPRCRCGCRSCQCLVFKAMKREEIKKRENGNWWEHV